MNFFEEKADYDVYHGNLPHWRQSTTCYFVTFRTADSIPQEKLKFWLKERQEWLLQHPQPHSDEEIKEYDKLFSRQMELWLDHNYGECILRNKVCKDIVVNAILHFNGHRYRIWDYIVAWNHVHLLIEPLGDYQLSDLMHSIKSFTAKAINKATGKSGHFWQKEYFDHIVRSEDQLSRFSKYIRRHNHIKVK